MCRSDLIFSCRRLEPLDKKYSLGKNGGYQIHGFGVFYTLLFYFILASSTEIYVLFILPLSRGRFFLASLFSGGAFILGSGRFDDLVGGSLLSGGIGRGRPVEALGLVAAACFFAGSPAGSAWR